MKKNTTQAQENRVLVLNASNDGEDFDFNKDSLDSLITHAEKQGTVYSLKYFEELLNKDEINISNSLVKFYQAAAAKTPEQQQFPNDFTSWKETYFEVVKHISHTEHHSGSAANIRSVEQGFGGLYELAEELADNFEKQYEGVNWGDTGPDYYDTIFEYLRAADQAAAKAYRLKGNITEA